VIPALIRRFHEAKEAKKPEVVIWGTGKACREFLYVDDMASASVFVMELDKVKIDQSTKPMQSHINVGYGADVTIAMLAQMVSDAVGFTGQIKYNSSMPDGPPKKLMDSRLISSLGWEPHVNLTEGLRMAYADFLNQHA
jgi:GDP-L-fucose synthase